MISIDSYINIFSYLKNDYKILKFVSKEYYEIIKYYCKLYNKNIRLTIDDICDSKNQYEWFIKYYDIKKSVLTLDFYVKNNFMNCIKKSIREANLPQIRLLRLRYISIKYGNIISYKYAINRQYVRKNIVKREYYSAIDYNQLEFLNYLIDKKNPQGFVDLYSYAICNNKLRALEYLYEKKFTITYSTSGIAALNNKFNILKWLNCKGCEINEWTLKCACHSGNLEMVKWIINHKNVQPTTESLYAACNNGNIELVKYIKNNFYLFWNMEHSVGAAQNNHVHVLKYINETYGRVYQQTLFYACIGNHFESIKYILTLGINPTKQMSEIENLLPEIRDFLIKKLK